MDDADAGVTIVEFRDIFTRTVAIVDGGENVGTLGVATATGLVRPCKLKNTRLNNKHNCFWFP